MKNLSTKISLIILIILSISSFNHAQQWYEKGTPHFLNENQFDSLVKNPQTRYNGVVILKFFTPWCRYCRYLKDIIDNINSQSSWSIKIYQVNCDSQNHDFCGSMGVRSYPKMVIYEDGQFKESMDGFYPYQVVRQLFVKYNRTRQHSQTVNEQSKQPSNQQLEKQSEPNYIEPSVLQPSKTQTQKQNSPSQQSKSKTQKQNPQSPKKTQQPSQNQQIPQPQHQKVTGDSVQQKNLKEKAQSPQNIQLGTVDKSQSQSQSQSKSKKEQTPKPKRPQQMIEQEQNIAIMDQNVKQTEKEKEIVQQVQKQQANLIDLTILPQTVQVHQYGKYIMYGICLLLGCYYFTHIMKAEPHSQSQKLSQNLNSKSNPLINKSAVSANVSIQDSELRQELNFQHPNQQEVNINSIQISDEDL